MIKFFDLSIVNKNINLNNYFRNFIQEYEYVLGTYVQEFEEKYADYLNIKHCVGVGNGTDGLVLALKALDINEHDKVGTVANAGFYTTSAINLIGAKPVFIDVNYQDQLIDLNDLEIKLKKHNISALFITHLYGNVVDMYKVRNITKKYNIKIIEDCSHAHGIKFNNRFVGSFGDISIFSFYPTKNLGAIGDAGAILTNSNKIYKKLLSLRQYGWGKKYSVVNKFGQNSRMDALQAGILSKKLDYLEDMNQSRTLIANKYDQKLSLLPLKISVKKRSLPYHLYVVRTNKRKQFINYLDQNKIQTQIHFPIPDNKQLIMKKLNQSLPVTEKLSKEIISLPFYPYMPVKIQNKIIKVIEEFFKK